MKKRKNVSCAGWKLFLRLACSAVSPPFLFLLGNGSECARHTTKLARQRRNHTTRMRRERRRRQKPVAKSDTTEEGKERVICRKILWHQTPSLPTTFSPETSPAHHSSYFTHTQKGKEERKILGFVVAGNPFAKIILKLLAVVWPLDADYFFRNSAGLQV